MQSNDQADLAAMVDRLIEEALPGHRGAAAWGAFLRAHATLMRHLATSLVEETGTTLGDFDVLGQLAMAGGALRMADLAARAFSSRANMTRRIDRLETEGLVRRSRAEDDARGITVHLTAAGQARLAEVAPIHMREVAARFIDPLDDAELAALEQILTRITRDCSFG